MPKLPFGAVATGAVTSGGTVLGQVLSRQTIDLSTACSVGVVVFSGVWWLSAKLQKIDSRLEEGEKRFDRIEAWMEKKKH